MTNDEIDMTKEGRNHKDEGRRQVPCADHSLHPSRFGIRTSFDIRSSTFVLISSP
jgi:hypothetical protein